MIDAEQMTVADYVIAIFVIAPLGMTLFTVEVFAIVTLLHRLFKWVDERFWED